MVYARIVWVFLIHDGFRGQRALMYYLAMWNSPKVGNLNSMRMTILMRRNTSRTVLGIYFQIYLKNQPPGRIIPLDDDIVLRFFVDPLFLLYRAFHN